MRSTRLRPQAVSQARRLAARVGLALTPAAPRLDGPFSTWSEAAAACGDGYQSLNLASWVARRTADRWQSGSPAQLSENDVRTISALAMSARGTGEIEVLDLGGAAGDSFFAALHFLPWLKISRWTVIETKPMMTAARQAIDIPSSLDFSCDLGAYEAVAGDRDLIVLANASIPYIEDATEVLTLLAQMRPTHVWLLRTVVASSNGVQPGFYVQSSRLMNNGPRAANEDSAPRRDDLVRYPLRLLSEQAITKGLSPVLVPSIRLVEDHAAMRVRTGSLPSVSLRYSAESR